MSINVYLYIGSDLWILHDHALKLLTLSRNISAFMVQQQILIDAYYSGVRTGFNRIVRNNTKNHGNDYPIDGNKSSQEIGYYHKCIHLLIHSLYIIPIYHWYSVFSKNLLIISAEVLQMHTNVKDTLLFKEMLKKWEYIYQFLGVHPLNNNRRVAGDIHEGDKRTRSKIIINNNTMDILMEFLNPFQLLLYQFIDNQKYKHTNANLVLKYVL